MTPKPSATPNKTSRQPDLAYQSSQPPAVILFEREEPKVEAMSMSQVTAIS